MPTAAWYQIGTKRWAVIVAYSLVVLALPIISEPGVLPGSSELIALALALAVLLGYSVRESWAPVVPLPSFAVLAVAPFLAELLPGLGLGVLADLAFYQDGLSIFAVYFACAISSGAAALGLGVHRFVATRRGVEGRQPRRQASGL